MGVREFLQTQLEPYVTRGKQSISEVARMRRNIGLYGAALLFALTTATASIPFVKAQDTGSQPNATPSAYYFPLVFDERPNLDSQVLIRTKQRDEHQVFTVTGNGFIYGAQRVENGEVRLQFITTGHQYDTFCSPEGRYDTQVISQTFQFAGDAQIYDASYLTARTCQQKKDQASGRVCLDPGEGFDFSVGAAWVRMGKNKWPARQIVGRNRPNIGETYSIKPVSVSGEFASPLSGSVITIEDPNNNGVHDNVNLTPIDPPINRILHGFSGTPVNSSQNPRIVQGIFAATKGDDSVPSEEYHISSIHVDEFITNPDCENVNFTPGSN